MTNQIQKMFYSEISNEKLDQAIEQGPKAIGELLGSLQWRRNENRRTNMQLYRKLDYDTEKITDADWCVDTQPPFYIRSVDLEAKEMFRNSGTDMKQFLDWFYNRYPEAFREAIRDYR